MLKSITFVHDHQRTFQPATPKKVANDAGTMPNRISVFEIPLLDR